MTRVQICNPCPYPETCSHFNRCVFFSQGPGAVSVADFAVDPHAEGRERGLRATDPLPVDAQGQDIEREP